MTTKKAVTKKAARKKANLLQDSKRNSLQNSTLTTAFPSGVTVGKGSVEIPYSSLPDLHTKLRAMADHVSSLALDLMIGRQFLGLQAASAIVFNCAGTNNPNTTLQQTGRNPMAVGNCIYQDVISAGCTHVPSFPVSPSTPLYIIINAIQGAS